MFRNLICLMVTSLVLVACAASGGAGNTLSAPMAAKGASLPPPDPIPVASRPDYRLGPSDIVDVRVFEADNLATTAQVTPAGSITLPLIGEVAANGKTASELSAEITRLYGARYLQNPQVSVLIKQTRTETYTVDGSVQNPGVYTIADRTSLLKAIATAKGLDQLADPTKVVVFRTVNNERGYGLFDLTAIRQGKAMDPAIYPNDVIVVASSGARRTLRDIIGVTPLLPLLFVAVP